MHRSLNGALERLVAECRAAHVCKTLPFSGCEGTKVALGSAGLRRLKIVPPSYQFDTLAGPSDRFGISELDFDHGRGVVILVYPPYHGWNNLTLRPISRFFAFIEKRLLHHFL